MRFKVMVRTQDGPRRKMHVRKVEVDERADAHDALASVLMAMSMEQPTTKIIELNVYEIPEAQ